jgi:hypothetical protein
VTEADPAPAASRRDRRRPATWFLLGAILALAFVARLAWRLHAGAAEFWTNGYTFFYAMATSLAAGHGLHATPAASETWHAGVWAARQPLYPLFLAATLPFGHDYLLIVIPQALMGTLTAACAFWLARRWFGVAAGLVAALLVAVYPYYVAHDTALQDTAMATAGGALAVCALLVARTSTRPWAWIAAGALAGLIVLVRGTMLPFSLGAVIWIALVGDGGPRARLLRAAVVGLTLAVVLGVWMARNEVRVGAPVLSTEVGEELFEANHPLTFSHYPAASVDLSANAVMRSMSPADQRAVLSRGEVGRNDWFMAHGLDWIGHHPGETAVGMVRKEVAAFSWVFSPAKDAATQAVYFASYAPILLLGLVGVATTARSGWREHSLVWLQFAGFAVVTAIFWAHTSHRSVLDVYLMVFAAPVVVRLAAWLWALTRFGRAATSRRA